MTVKINDDYIVCPRAGGKIEVEGYKGFFLCPDYNLMCSGTVICNDMFECVDKKSLVKNSSYYYDYEIKTSQNLDDAYIIDADNITNYELSENAICPIYCKHCKENQKCVKCRNGYELVGYSNSQKVECLNKSIVSSGYYKSGDNIYYRCIENCDKCNSQQCSLFKNNYIFINNNFSECILKDSINLEFYYTYDNITYFSCKDIRYQNNEKCQKILNKTISEIQTTIPNNPKIISTTQIIKTTVPTNNLILPITNTLTTQLNQIHTIIIEKETKEIKEKIFFFLQVQIINGKIFIFLIINFQITKDTEFIFSLTMYLSKNLRNLEENKVTKEISFHPKEEYNENGDKIVSLISDEEVNDTRIVINELKNEEDIKVKTANDNSDILDTQKVKEAIKQGGVDFSSIAENGDNYIISQYKIISSSSGCDFSLISDNRINQNNKSIELSFRETENNKNNIRAKCYLSNDYGNKIICNLDREINNYYLLNPYISSDEKEIITIVQKDINDYLSLQCDLIETSANQIEKPKKEGGLSIGAIIGIIAGIIFVVIVVGVVISIIKCCKNKKNYNPNFASKVKEYPNSSSNIKI